MVVVPAAIPVTIPDVPTVPIVVFVLLHVPPVAISLKVVLGQAISIPAIAPALGAGLTVTIVVAVQPVNNVLVNTV